MIKSSYVAQIKMLICSLALLFATRPAFSQEQGPSGAPAQAQVQMAATQAQPAAALVTNPFVVRGIIKSASTPLPGVTVTAANTLTGKKIATATAPDGSFTLVLPSRGRYVIKAELAAFAALTKEVIITPQAPQATVDADLMLASRAQILAAQQQQQLQQQGAETSQQQIATALAN